MKRVYEQFRALGMPEGVSLEAFGRVMGGRGAAESDGVGSAAGNLKGAEKGKGKDERVRMHLNSRSRGRDQQQPQQEEEGAGEGDWNIALTFLSTHLVGRQEASRARGVISRCVGFSLLYVPSKHHLYMLLLILSPHINRARAEIANPSQHPGVSKIKAPSVSVSAVSATQAPDKLTDLLVDPMALAARKRDMAYRALDATRREWEEVSAGVRVLGELLPF